MEGSEATLMIMLKEYSDASLYFIIKQVSQFYGAVKTCHTFQNGQIQTVRQSRFLHTGFILINKFMFK